MTFKAKEKKDKERAFKREDLKQEGHELGDTNGSDFMTENPATGQSQLAAHRVIPYHFKGFNAQQTAQVMSERENQIKEKEVRLLNS